MTKISLLPESIYKRIAAGEVIINPAAAVKELVENAIDAGATAVTVEILEGGRDFIRVTDNGTGMSVEDLRMSVKKHATSKISAFEDVYALESLGFRGEALASIAEVAHLTISTREHSTSIGWELTVRGGSEPEIEEKGLPSGTTVRVDDLFYNVPARRKFLKSAAKEGAAVSETVKRLILSRPGIAFKYLRNGRVAYQTPGDGDLRTAAAVIYGSDMLPHMQDVSYKSSHSSIHGIISKPTYIFKTPQRLEFFLNGRYVQSKRLQKALIQGYKGSILTGHYPAGILFIDTDPTTVDFNIHPAKLEVLLFQEEDILGDVTTAVSQAVLKEIEPPQLTADMLLTPDKEPQYDAPRRQADFFQTVRSRDLQPHVQEPQADAIQETLPENGEEPAADTPDETEDAYTAEPFADTFRQVTAPEEPVEGPVPDIRRITDYRIIGTAFSTYILCEVGDVIYMIDQHAAQERLTYDNILSWVEKGRRYGQLLLEPVIKTFREEDYALLVKFHDLLKSLGLDFEPFGDLTLRFVSFPLQILMTNTDIFLDSITEELRSYGDDAVVCRDRLITQACRYSVKAGTDLTEPEIAHLVTKLTEMDSIPHCPHGRPIAVALKRAELEKGFRRRV